MRAPSELEMLATLRARGQAPELDVWVTNNDTLRENLMRAGALAIRVVSDHWVCDWSALSGLSVVLYTSFDETPVGTRLAKAICNARPRRLQRFVVGKDPHFTTLWPAKSAPMEEVQ
jgi:hypothetical protein